MLTREDILTLPADRLPEVSARMMIHHGGIFGNPHIDYNDARDVADWVRDQWAGLTHPRGETFKASDPKDAIDFTLDETRGTYNYHWAWTPEQLTRAALLAFADNGGEIE